MLINKTQYSTLTNEELIKLADQQGFNLSEMGLEFMERLSESVDTIKKLQDENVAADDEIYTLRNSIESLEESSGDNDREIYLLSKLIDTLQNGNYELKNELDRQ